MPLLLLLSIGSPAWAQPDALPPAARDVLRRFEGQWETQTTIRREGDPPREINTRGRGTCQRTLAGRYFEFRTETDPPGESELQVMTFDQKTGKYRQWVFSSDGYSHSAEGTWDPTTSTLRWTGSAEGASFVIDDRFVAPDRLEWTLRRTSSSGQLVQTIEGTLVRVNKN